MSSKKRTSKKFDHYKPDDIKDYLNKFRKCVLEGRYTISQNENRKENIDFIEDYKIDSKKEREFYWDYNLMIFAMQ
ncbi:MAG: hypothetical protein PHQ67_11060 [Fermentimonas sp.]|nr:hypothetical protein [Fermentimonas sp.]MDD4010324.1 hypothetical protein [Fermentimonas sp.]